MSEQESNPKSEKDLEGESVANLEKLSEIEKEKPATVTPNQAIFKKEENAFEGKSEASSFMIELGKKDDQKEALKHQNENLRLQSENLRLKNQLLEHKNQVEKFQIQNELNIQVNCLS